MSKEELSICLLHGRLKPLMEARGITYRVLSKKSGVPAKTLYGWSAGNNPRKISDVHKVAKILGVSIEELCFRPQVDRSTRNRALNRKAGNTMLADIEPMNNELRECLSHARTKASITEDNIFSDKIADFQIIFDRPVMVPCYLLFAISHELGVAKEVYEIITSYEWQFKCRKS